MNNSIWSMTFEEFRKLALNPPYIDQDSVYRVDVHCFAKSAEKRVLRGTQFEVVRDHSLVYPDLNLAERKLKHLIGDESLQSKLYAVYIYQLPIGKDVSSNLYQRLWVYDRWGNLNGQSRCTAIIEDLDHPSAKFRGHEMKSIRFKPGEIVEVYDRNKEIVRLATIVKQPLTVEQCWEERNTVEMTCELEGVGADCADDNYWLYANDDIYHVLIGSGFGGISISSTYDVFALKFPMSIELRQRFTEKYHCEMSRLIDLQ